MYLIVRGDMENTEILQFIVGRRSADIKGKIKSRANWDAYTTYYALLWITPKGHITKETFLSKDGKWTDWNIVDHPSKWSYLPPAPSKRKRFVW